MVQIALDQGTGYGIVLGLGIAFALGMVGLAPELRGAHGSAFARGG
jgi:hypothetical protein